jgi:outer membrane protein assembly factor BamC
MAMRRVRLAPVWVAAWIGGTTLLGGCSWLHFGSSDEEAYDYRKSKPRQEPLEVPPDLSQLPKDERFALPSANGAKSAAAATATPAATVAVVPAGAATAANAGTAPVIDPAAAAQLTPAGLSVAPAATNAHIERDGNFRWLAVDASPELVYTTLKSLWINLGYKIDVDEPLIGIVETNWAEVHPEMDEDVIRNGLHKAFGAFDSNGVRNRFRARIERTASNSTEVFITHRTMEEVLQGVYKDSSKWQMRPADPELEVEMLRRLAVRLMPAQPLRVAVADGTAAAATAVAPAAVASTAAEDKALLSPAPSRVHKVASGGAMTLQVEDSIDHVWRQVGGALDRGGFTVEERRREKRIYAVRYLDPDYEASEREKRSWWDRVFNSDAKVPEQQFLIALTSTGSATSIEVQDRDGRPDGGATARRIVDQLMEQLR